MLLNYSKNIFQFGNKFFIFQCIGFTQGVEILELKINNNEPVIKEIIEKFSSEADEKPGMGITGFMFSVAKSILINFWEYGYLIEYHYTNDMERKKYLKLKRII
ncbi:MAG: hypothetical protein HPY57_15040 [Ignavibacteria bacterium]|nr:hypothetical protein [Ignavibacteria bacterium]